MRIRDLVEKSETKSNGPELRLPKLRKGDQIWLSGDIEDHATITGTTNDPLTKQPKLKTSKGTKDLFAFRIPKHKLTDALITHLSSLNEGDTTDLSQFELSPEEQKAIIAGYDVIKGHVQYDPNDPSHHRQIKIRMIAFDMLPPDSKRYVHDNSLEAYIELAPDMWRMYMQKATDEFNKLNGVSESRRAKPAKIQALRPSSLLNAVDTCLDMAKSPYWDFSPSKAWIKDFDAALADAGKAHGDGFRGATIRPHTAEVIRRRHNNLYRVDSEISDHVGEYKRYLELADHVAMISDGDYLNAMNAQRKAASLLEHSGRFDDDLNGMHMALNQTMEMFSAMSQGHAAQQHPPEFVPTLLRYLEGFLPFCRYIFGK